MMSIAPWTLAGTLVYSVAITLLTNWAVSGFGRPRLPQRLTLENAISALVDLLWIVIVFVFGVLALRYIERMTNVVLGCILFGALGLGLSWMRAYLYRRVRMRNRSGQNSDWQGLASVIVHNLTYLLFASVLYLAILGLQRQPIDLVLLVPLCIGALLPDLDSRDSLPGRLLPWISQRLETRLGHLEEWHTLPTMALVALVAAPLILIFDLQAWFLILLGFLAHLLLDMLAPEGIMLLWPVRRTRYGVFGGIVQSPGCLAERWIAAGLAVAGLVLLFAVDLGRPKTSPAPSPSYEQTLDQYYSMRGRTQVFAYIDGSWQISGRPISGRFEILNASGQSFVVLDRYSGDLFTGGRSGDDNVYLNRIILQSGPSVLVKPVEVHLEHQPLGDALGIVYEMQTEPGVQHIYTTGDLLLPDQQNTTNPALQADHSQTNLRQIRAHGLGRYSLHYLSAAELIELADLQVEAADLIFVATYARPAEGPTATALPRPQTPSEPAQ